MPFLLKLIVPVVTGAVASTAVMVGLVYSQTKAPDTNPASKPIIAYGNNS